MINSYNIGILQNDTHEQHEYSKKRPDNTSPQKQSN